MKRIDHVAEPDDSTWLPMVSVAEESSVEVGSAALPARISLRTAKVGGPGGGDEIVETEIVRETWPVAADRARHLVDGDAIAGGGRRDRQMAAGIDRRREAGDAVDGVDQIAGRRE